MKAGEAPLNHLLAPIQDLLDEIDFDFTTDARPNDIKAVMRDRLTTETARVNAAYQLLRTDPAGARRRFDPAAPSSATSGPSTPTVGGDYTPPAYVPATRCWTSPVAPATWRVAGPSA